MPAIFFTQSRVFNTGQEFASTMLTSSTVTASAAGLRRLPLQVGQGRSDMNSLIFSRMYSELVSLIAPFKIGDHTFKGTRELEFIAIGVLVSHLDLFVACAV